MISEQLTTELVQQLIGKARVLERRQVLQVLAELDLQKTDLTAAEVSRVGRQLGADAIVLGSATTIGDQIVVNVRVVAVTGGEVLSANRMNVQASQNLLVLGISGENGPSMVPNPAPEAIPPRPSNVAPRTSSAFRGTIGSVTIELQTCAQSGGTIRCELLLTNNGDDGNFTLHGYSSRLFDSGGNGYRGNTAQVANRDGENAQATLVAGIPTRASLTFRGVAETTQLPLLEISGYMNGAETLRFRNVPVR